MLGEVREQDVCPGVRWDLCFVLSCWQLRSCWVEPDLRLLCYFIGFDVGTGQIIRCLSAEGMGNRGALLFFKCCYLFGKYSLSPKAVVR